MNEDLDRGYYADRESDADSGSRIEIHECNMEHEDILKRLVVLGNRLSNRGEELVRLGDRTKNEALRDLSEYNAKD